MKWQDEVVITGVGVVAPCGIGVESFWNALLSGRSGIDRLSIAADASLPVTIGGQVREFNPGEYVRPRKRLKLMCREMQTGCAAASLAVSDAGLENSQVHPERMGVVFGGEIYYGPVEEAAEAYRGCIVDGEMKSEMWGETFTGKLNPLYMLRTLPNMCACHIAIGHDARGPCNTIVSGDVSSLLAVIEAARLIERGVADVVIAGGSGTRLNTLRMVKHDLDDVAQHADDPTSASRPFDARRNGAVLGEGAAAIVLESRRHAQQRNADILARLSGSHTCFVPNSAANGVAIRGIQRSIAGSMQKGRIDANNLGHVNAHGTSMVASDRIEAQAIHASLGNTPVTAPKSYFGCLGAGTGAVELAVSVLAVTKGVVPATLNYQQPDPDCPVNVICGDPMETRKRSALVLNQTSFGQFASVLVVANDD